MNRRELLAGCVLLPLARLFPKQFEPEKADPIPSGFKETLRCEIKGRQHVIFSKDERRFGRIIKRWRLYIDGRFDYEGIEKSEGK